MPDSQGHTINEPKINIHEFLPDSKHDKLANLEWIWSM